jgi:hypothetical protein
VNRNGRGAVRRNCPYLFMSSMTIRPFTLEEAFPAYEFTLYIAAMSTVCIDSACQFVDFDSHECYSSWEA